MAELKMPGRPETVISTKKTINTITSDVGTRKKRIGSHLSDSLDSLKSIDLKSEIVDDVIMPGIKGFFSDTINSIIEAVCEIALNTKDIMIWGEKQSRKNRKKSYSSIYDQKRSGRKREERERSALDYEDITFKSKIDAKDVLDQLKGLCEEYDCASVSDFYQSVGMDHTFADEKYGWTNLNSAYISRDRDGRYILNLPKARPLD